MTAVGSRQEWRRPPDRCTFPSILACPVEAAPLPDYSQKSKKLSHELHELHE